VSRFAADSMHPASACELIRSRAEQAIRAAPTARLPTITMPATLDVAFRNADLAELAAWVEGVDQTGPTSVRLVDDDPIGLYRSFVHIIVLTRGIAE
jgi:D-amino peptidase